MAKKYETINVDTMSQNITIDSSSKSGLDFGSKTWSGAIKTVAASGNDLVITTKSEGNYTVTLKNYFAKNGKHPIKFIKTADEVNGERSIIDYVNMENIYGDAQIITGSGTLKGTVFNDTITGGALGDKIFGYGGDDTIDGAAGNDTITGGAGENTVLLYTTKKFGNDVVNLTKGEYLVLKLADATNMSAVTNELVGNDLVITVNKGGEYESTVTVKNYRNKDVITDAGSFILVDKNNNLLYDYRHSYTVETFMDGDEGHFAGKTFNGTWLNDDVNAEDYKAKDKQGNVITTNTDKVKGVTINLGNAPEMNMAHGSIYADTIKGGAGSDDIFGGKGNDVITGGKGLTLVHYVKGDGADVINLTKGEYFVLIFDNTGDANTLTRDDLKFAYVNNKKDLKLYYLDDDGNEAGSVTLKNFAKKDVTNNATKKTSDTSEVMVQFGDSQPIDLRDTLIHSYVDKANFTGGWLRDYIDASNSDELFKKGKHKNMVLNGGKGDDKIVGSRYADTLKGGVGDDELEGGKGNDLLYGEAGKNTFVFNSGDGVDTVYSGKGIDTLKFVGEDNGQALVSFEVGENNRDLYVKYGMNRSSYVIVKDYYDKKGNLNPKCSVKYLQFGNQVVEIEDAREQAENDFKDIAMFDVQGNVTAAENTQYIITRDGTDDNIDLTPSTKSDVSVNSKSGNDTITGRTDTNVNYTILGTDGNKNITTGGGNDTIEVGDGTHNIRAGNGTNTITTGDTPTGTTEITTGTGNDTITVGDGMYEINAGSGTNVITAGDSTTGETYITTDSGDDTITVGNGDHTISAGNGTNIITAENGDQTITTGGGNDTIEVGDGNHTINSGDGNDTITAGDGYNNITTGYGTKKITVGDSTADDNNGSDITINSSDYHNENSKITAGSGDDTLNFNAYVVSNAEINMGDGNNDITVTSEAINNSTIKAGDGNNTVTIGRTNNANYTNTIKLGNATEDGQNTITTGIGKLDIETGDGKAVITIASKDNTASGYTQKVKTGNGDDEIHIYGYGVDSVIDAGSGDNTIYYKDGVSGYSESNTQITTGNGDDNITIGYFNDSGVAVGSHGGNTINAGGGENNITIGYGSLNTITTGEDDDRISIGEKATSNGAYYNTINAGEGDNTVIITGNSSYGNTVTTGSGDDTITLGSGSNTENENYWNVIKAGDGANVITGGSGTFKITAGNSTVTDTENENYNIGSNITLGRTGGYYNEYTTVTTGSGDDTIEFKGYLHDSEVNAGDGDNKLTLRDDTANTNITTGSGDDSVVIEDSFYGSDSDNRSTINLGAGKNSLTTEYIRYSDITTTGDKKQDITVGNMGSYVNISTGSGDDEINVSGYGYNSTITTTGGNNKITYGDNMNGWGGSSHNEDDHYGKITTGSGNDEITIGTFDEEGNTLGGVQGTIINAGDGENVIKVADECYYTQITTGKDKDIITVGAKSGGNIINAGDGDNEVYLAKDGEAYGSYSITTGSGDDTIVVGDDGYSSTKKIDAGAGKNTITVGGVYYGVDITTTGNEVQNITVGKEDKSSSSVKITTGGGDDNITLFGEVDSANITSAGGNNKIENLNNGSDSVTITTGSGDDNINFAGYSSKIYAGAGDNTIVATNTGNTIETGGGKDDITLGDDSNNWAYNTVNIGHAERDVKGEWNDEIEDYDYTHEQALEGGAENTVLIKNQYSNEINIYNTQTVDGKYNTVTVEGTGGRHKINITGGHSKVDLGTTSENTVTTGSGDDIITAAGDSNTINAGGGDNNITVSGKSNEINTASGKDTITYTGTGAWDNTDIYIGHEERDVFDHWDEDTGEEVKRHELALEGGAENTVNITDGFNVDVNIYNTSTVEDKYNTINVTGNSDSVYINVSGGHTKVNFDTELDCGGGYITTGNGDDKITGLGYGSIDAGDGDNIITMREYQIDSRIDITTGSGKDTIDIYDYADIRTGAGDDIINAHVVDAENYGGDDPENRGNYNITASMGAGNDVLNIDEGFKGGLNLNLKLGDGGSNTINGITDSISSIYIDIDPNCEYYVRPSASDNTDLEIVLIENGAESGDVMTLKGVLKNQADHEPIIHDIYINDSYIGDIKSHWNEGLGDYEYYWEYSVPTSNDFIINGDHSMSGEIPGTEGDDVIYGSDGDDIIKPKYGDDVIRPGKGDDIIDLESKNGNKSIHFNIGDGNLTIQNSLQYTVSLYMEGVESGDFTIEKRGKDYCIVRSNGETLTIKDLYEDDGYMGYYNAYIYDKDGESYNYIGAFASDSKIDKPIHIYAPEDEESYELVEDHYSKSIFHVSDNVVSIVTHGDSDVVIYGMPYVDGHGATQVKLDWSSSSKFSRYVREGDNLLIKTAINEDYFYTNEEYMWLDSNMRTTTIVDFFKEHNKVDYFIFGDRGINYYSIVSEAMTQAVDKTTDEGETLTKPNNDDWWMGSYTYNAGDGNDTIIATGNADVAYGNGGNDDIYMYNPDAPDNYLEWGGSGLFDGGEGNDTYYVKFASSGTHTIVADKGQDSLVVANAKDTYGGINFDVTDTNTYSMSADGKDIVLTSNDYLIDNELVIKDALFKKIDLTISDTVNSLSLKEMMEANNIYVSSYQTDPENLYGSMGSDIMYAHEDCSNVYGFVGSDTIYAFGDKNVYTLGGGEPGSNGFKDTQVGTIDRVELYGFHNTVYAQSETNIINSYNSDYYWENSVLVESTDDYFAYLDQSTTINDAYGNDSLTIMNTYLTEDGQYEIGGMQNLYIMCDFGDNYSGDFDLLLFNNANLLKWQNGYDMDEDSSNDPKCIRIKYNEIETITTADGYKITSEQIAELADSISNWMYYGNDGNQYFGSMDELRTAEHQSDMNLLVQYVQEQAATMWTQA